MNIGHGIINPVNAINDFTGVAWCETYGGRLCVSQSCVDAGVSTPRWRGRSTAAPITTTQKNVIKTFISKVKWCKKKTGGKGTKSMKEITQSHFLVKSNDIIKLVPALIKIATYGWSRLIIILSCQGKSNEGLKKKQGSECCCCCDIEIRTQGSLTALRLHVGSCVGGRREKNIE